MSDVVDYFKDCVVIIAPRPRRTHTLLMPCSRCRYMAPVTVDTVCAPCLTDPARSLDKADPMDQWIGKVWRGKWKDMPMFARCPCPTLPLTKWLPKARATIQDSQKIGSDADLRTSFLDSLDRWHRYANPP